MDEDFKISETDVQNSIIQDIHDQAVQGLGVPVDPDIAENLGAFEEDAVTLKDILEDQAARDIAVKEGMLDPQ